MTHAEQRTPYLDEIKEFFDPDKKYIRAFSYLMRLIYQPPELRVKVF